VRFCSRNQRSSTITEPIWEDEEEPICEVSDDEESSSKSSSSSSSSADDSSDSQSPGAVPKPTPRFALSKGGRRNFRSLTLPTSSSRARGKPLVTLAKGKSTHPMDGFGTSAEREEVGTISRESIRKIGPVVATNSPNSKVNREKQFKFLKRMRQKETRDKAKADLAWRRANGVGGKPIPKKRKNMF